MSIFDLLPKGQYNEYISEFLRECAEILYPMDKITSDVPLTPIVALMVKELRRKGFNIEYEFEATNIFAISDDGADIKWKNEFVREVRAFGIETPELELMLKSSGFKQIKDGHWSHKPEPKKLILSK